MADATLRLTAETRASLLAALATALDEYATDVGEAGASLAAGAVTPMAPVSDADVAAALDGFDLDEPMDPLLALRRAVRALRTLQPQVSHPRHFGLFDAAPTTMGVVGAALTAAFNPCLASWEGSPFGVAAEQRLVTDVGSRFGYPADVVDGIMTTGGSEANYAALLLALTRRHPRFRAEGVRALPAPPTVYVSGEAHPSTTKAATLAGLGANAVRVVPVDTTLRMDVDALGEQVRADIAAGYAPLLVTATVGTTGAGVIDPLPDVLAVAERHGLWCHVDAAWGGVAALLPELREHVDGIERADSITFDPHKWMSVPLGAGMLLTRHPGLLTETFAVGDSFLREPDRDTRDLYLKSPRWSREFAGLKLLLSLAVAGWSGYRAAWREQVRLADRLRATLTSRGWSIRNETPLPVVCFGLPPGLLPGTGQGDADDVLAAVANDVNASGQARIHQVRVGDGTALRVNITHDNTTADDVDLLADLLDTARAANSPLRIAT